MAPVGVAPWVAGELMLSVPGAAIPQTGTAGSEVPTHGDAEYIASWPWILRRGATANRDGDIARTTIVVASPGRIILTTTYKEQWKAKHRDELFNVVHEDSFFWVKKYMVRCRVKFMVLQNIFA